MAMRTVIGFPRAACEPHPPGPAGVYYAGERIGKEIGASRSAAGHVQLDGSESHTRYPAAMKLSLLPQIMTVIALVHAGSTAEAAWHFTDVTASAGLSYQHGYTAGPGFREPSEHAGGVAAGDYD